MRGKDEKLLELFNANGKRFIIPAYQRNYDWKQENCERLFNDLVALHQSKRDGHFFGSVVSVESEDGFSTERLVIDGQQRLTTVSLLLLAMYRLLASGEVEAAQGGLQEHIFKSYLNDGTSTHDVKLRLKLVKSDQLAFEKLFNDETDHIPSSNLTINYNYFIARIRKKEISIDELFQAIRHLIVINVELKQEDDPQLVFESLNSTGVALTEGDKIRNFVLMGLPPKTQDSLYEKYWNPIEACTEYNVSDFIRDYLSVKTTVIATQNKVYEAFKVFRQQSDATPEELLKDIYEYAKLYRILLTGKTDCSELNNSIFRLNWLETSITRPFFLEVLRLERDGVLKSEEVADIFKTVETYLYRRQICEIPTNALNKIFLVLHKDILKLDGTTTDYLAKFKYILKNKRDRGVFPKDLEFCESFRMRNIYKMNSRSRTYTLERLENFGTKETKDVYRMIEDGSLTIEHVMPQILVPAWIESLGEGYEEIHETWLHRVANLTLTAYNSKYSNNSFEQKLSMKNGFKDSGIRLNHWIGQQQEWGVEQLEERSRQLAERAVEIWPIPDEGDFKPERIERNTVSLDDDVNFRGMQISGFLFKGSEQKTATWIEMFDAVLRQLHSSDKSILAKLAASTNPSLKLSQYFSIDGTGLREGTELDSGIYYERNSNTEIKIVILRELFRQFNISQDELSFIIRESEDKKQTEDLKAWREVRQKYWEFALPIMREANSSNGMFQGCNPSGDNWSSGFFGIGGVHISCVANYNCARVELYISGSVKFNAKELFDMLKKYETEIETTGFGGIKLHWNRGNETKHARVFVCNDSVSVDRQNDWKQMASFHAEWSQRFYDVFLPYVRRFVGEED